MLILSILIFDIGLIIHELRQQKISIDEPTDRLLRFLSVCHGFFADATTKAFVVFDSLGFVPTDLKRFLFHHTNNQFLLLSKGIAEQVENEFDFDLEKVESLALELKSGQKVRAKFALEMNVDALQELLVIVDRWIPGVTSLKQFNPREDVKENLREYQYLFYLSNILLNIRTSAFEIVIYEKGDVEFRSDDVIKIASGAEKILLLKSANGVRSDNLRNEFQFPLMALAKSRHLKRQHLKATIRNGFLEFAPEETAEGLLIVNRFLPALWLNYEFVQDDKLEYFGGLTLTDLGECLALLDVAVSNFINSNDIRVLPIKINEAQLLTALCSVSGHHTEVMRKFVDSLKSRRQSPYFWRHPFYEDQGDLLFAILPLTSQNYALYYDKWLRLSGISTQRNEALLRNIMVSEFNDKHLPYAAKAEIMEGAGNENIFTIKTRDVFAIIQVNIFDFPIEVKEVALAFENVRNAAKDLNARIKLLAPEIKDKLGDKTIVIGALLTNHSIFSGCVINKIAITDKQLLLNYFHTGKYQRVRVALNKESFGDLNELGAIHYYKNEDEFNSNLVNFLSSPPPVNQIMQRYYSSELEITPEHVRPRFLIDTIEQMPDDQLIKSQIDEMSDVVKAIKLKSKEDDHQVYTEAIEFQLNRVFSRLAFSSYEINRMRSVVAAALRGGRELSVIHLAFYIYKSIGKLSGSKLVPDKTFNKVEYSDVHIFELLEKLKPEHSNIRLSDFVLGPEFTDDEARKIISCCVEMIPMSTRKFLGEEDVVTLLFLVSLLKGFKDRMGIDHEFYTACTNVVDLLNNNNHYQKARDFSEEVMIIASKERKHFYGWDLLFRCYTAQKNTLDASICGCLLISSVSALGEVPYSILVEVLYGALKYFRNFRYYEFANVVYQNLKEVKLNEYDEQKIAITYFNMLVFAGFNDKAGRIEDVFEYVEKEKENIASYGHHGAIPWLVLLYNIKRLRKAGTVRFNYNIEKVIKFFEAILDEETVKSIRDRIIGNPSKSKEIYIRALSRALETRTSIDFVYEVRNLEHFADNLLQDSIFRNDTEGVLLTSFVLNDHSFSYDNKDVEPGTIVDFKNFENEDWEEKLSHYQDYILKSIQLKQDTCFMWLFTMRRKVFVLVILPDKSIYVTELANWDLKKSNEWLAKLEKFSFNANESRHYDLTAQEADYEKVKEELGFTSVDLPEAVSEVVYSASIDMSIFPHNLILTNNDFVGRTKAIANIISLEWFIKNGNPVSIPFPYTMSVWIPTEDQETIVNWGAEIVGRVLISMPHKLYTSRYPELEISTDINIFLAHGQIDKAGFKAVYSNPEKDDVIAYPHSVFGTGMIAILFICHSGSSKQEVYSNNIFSLAAELIKSGYKAVAAPFWPLDVTVSGIWLKEFLTLFNGGFSMAEAVHGSNIKLLEYDLESGNQFYAPQGSMAMHLYGNPNVYVQIPNEAKSL